MTQEKARMWSRMVLRSLFTHPAMSRTKGRAAITLLNPSNVADPDATLEESLFRPFPHRGILPLLVTGSNLTNVFSMRHFWDDAITIVYLRINPYD